MRVLAFVLAIVLFTLSAAKAETASPDDNARFLAGMPLRSESPLAALAQTNAWKAHESAFDAAFTKVEARQLSKVRDWAKSNLTSHRPTLFYMFSGPDFLYANSFFPNATTYVLAGLEPAGAIPDISKLPKASVPKVLRAMQTSVRSLLNISFFITANMQPELRASPVQGTLPVLYVFLARSGKVIHDVALVQVDESGDVQSGPDAAKPKSRVRGVKITFASPGGPEQTLYYFSTELADVGFKTSGFAKFLDKLGDGDGLVKSASYLLYGGNFSSLRQFLLQKTKLILQDDTGIPVQYFGRQWDLHPFGRYLVPIHVFARQYQPRLAELFRKDKPKPLGFVIGYRSRSNGSNLLLAIKKDLPAAHNP